MKRFWTLFVILFIFSYWVNVASAQNAVEIVRIPDANLAAQLRKALGLAPTALITKQAMAQLTTLDASRDRKEELDFPISDLTGLEHATQLEELALWQHQEIRDISPLAGLTQLKKLTLGRNVISDISPLAELTQLRELHLGNNQISDISPLAGLTQLWNLVLYRNQIRDISPLAGLKQLSVLHLAENQIRDISPLAGLTELRDLGFLGLGDNQISDISPLSGLTELEALDLVNNRIIDVTPLAGLVNLEKLALAGNPIRDASPLANLTRLVEVDLEIPNQVRAGGVIPDRHLAGAVRTTLGLTNIEPITRQKLRGLKILNLAHNTQVSSLTGLEHAVHLEALIFNRSKIGGDISPLTNLTRLYYLSLNESQISDISALANLTQLTTLDLGLNQISDISPLANLTRLTRLGLSDNEISDVSPLTRLVNLETLSLAGNPIEDASPLAKLPKLWDVDIKIPQPPIYSIEKAKGYTQLSLPEGAKARLGKGSLSGGNRGIAFSPNGDSLAVASDIGIWIYDVETQREQTLITGHKRSVFSISFSPDGSLLASGSMDGTLKLWNVETNKNIATLEEGFVAYSPVGRVPIVFSSDGSLLASGGSRNAIKLWDVNTKKNIATLNGHTDSISCVAFSPDGSLLASGAWDGTVKLWDIAEKKIFATLKTEEWLISSVAFSPDGAILVSGGPRSVKLWDVTTGENTFTFEALTGGRQSIAFSPSGRTLAYISLMSVKLWDVGTKTEIATLQGAGANLFSVAFSPDGATVAAGSWDNTVWLWDVQTRKSIAILQGHTSWVTSVAISPDGTTLASGMYGYLFNLKLWNIATGESIATFFTRNLISVSSIAYSPNGKKLITGEAHPVQVSGTHGGTVNLWNVATRENIATFAGHTDWVYSVAISPDGRVIASGGGEDSDYIIRLWDAQDGTRLKTFTGHTARVSSVAFSPDGNTLVSGSWDNSIRLWDVATGKQETTLIGHTGSVKSVTFSPDGRIIASGGADSTIRLWDASSGKHYKTLTEPIGHTRGCVSSVAFSPNSRTLASGSSDGTIGLWNASSGAHYKTLTGHTGDVESITFSANGDIFASGSADGTVLLWTLTPAILEPEKTRKITTDINGDGVMNIQDLVLVATNLGKTGENEADVNTDGTVDVRDLVLVAGALGKVVAAPALHPHLLGALATTDIKEWLSEAKQINLTDSTSLRGILFLQQLLTMLTPKETALLPNFPNPFNPETWIPYQLAEPADVTVSIYAADGRLVRTLDLGHRSVGIYESRSHAAYWDGRNELGEPMASGVYFYTLTADDFTATRKMLILK